MLAVCQALEIQRGHESLWKQTKHLRQFQTVMRAVKQRSPTFLAPGTGFVEDSFSGGLGALVQAVMPAMERNGERQMKLRSLARRSPPALRPGS